MLTGSTITGVSSPASWRGGSFPPSCSLSGLSGAKVSCRLSLPSRGEPWGVFLLAFRMIELFVVEGAFDDSEMDDEELAALATLLDVSTTDRERSRCFCRNLGNFEPCDVEDGEDGDGECLEDLLLLDIAVEEGVVAVVIVVAGEREVADWDAPTELTAPTTFKALLRRAQAHPRRTHFSAQSAEMQPAVSPARPCPAAGVVAVPVEVGVDEALRMSWNLRG